MPCSESSFVIELKSSLPFAEFVVKKMTVVKVFKMCSVFFYILSLIKKNELLRFID